MGVATIGLVIALVGGGCATRADDRALERPTDTSTTSSTTTSTSTAVTSTTTAPSTTTTPPTTAPPTTTPPTTTQTEPTDPALVPGSSCTLGSHPDCIDPDGDGVGTYLQFGAECMAAWPESPGLCSDLDQDGVAGYPDSG